MASWKYLFWVFHKGALKVMKLMTLSLWCFCNWHWMTSVYSLPTKKSRLRPHWLLHSQGHRIFGILDTINVCFRVAKWHVSFWFEGQDLQCLATTVYPRLLTLSAPGELYNGWPCALTQSRAQTGFIKSSIGNYSYSVYSM